MIIIQPLIIIIYWIKKKNINKTMLVIYSLIVLDFLSYIYIFFVSILSNCNELGIRLNNTYNQNDIEKHGYLIQYSHIKMRNKDGKNIKYLMQDMN